MERKLRTNKKDRAEWLPLRSCFTCPVYIKIAFQWGENNNTYREFVTVPRFFVLNKRVNASSGKAEMLIDYKCRNFEKLKGCFQKKSSALKRLLHQIDWPQAMQF